MVRRRPLLKVLTETGPLLALAVALALLVVGPASAQFFNFGGAPQRPAPRSGGWFGGGWFGSDFFAPFRGGGGGPEAPKPRVYQDFSKAPPPEKREGC